MYLHNKYDTSQSEGKDNYAIGIANMNARNFKHPINFFNKTQSNRIKDVFPNYIQRKTITKCKGTPRAYDKSFFQVI
jgi:hypothetical protein